MTNNFGDRATSAYKEYYKNNWVLIIIVSAIVIVGYILIRISNNEGPLSGLGMALIALALLLALVIRIFRGTPIFKKHLIEEGRKQRQEQKKGL